MNLFVRTGALVATGALAAGTLLLAPTAQADPSPSGTSAAGWLDKELPNGVFGDDCASYCGPSIDAALSLAQLGDTAGFAKVRDAVGAQLTAYTDYAYTDGGDAYTGRAAGGVAKELVLAEVAGANPRSFGTPATDLVARLEALVGANGRIADQATKNGMPDPSSDYASTIGQTFAVRGLAAAGSAKATVATNYLLAQQCPGGYFRASFPATTADSPCAADAASPGADTTAYAVVALQGQLATPAVKNAVDKAVAWLKANQQTDGSFLSAEGAKNSNSTGLAGWALGQSCQVDAADRAAAFVRTLQIPATQTGGLASEKGAIAFTAANLITSQASGSIKSADRPSYWTATAQAAGTLGWDPSAIPTIALSAPAGFVKGRSDATVTVTGAAAGERVCLTGPKGVQALTGTGQPLTVTIPVPKRSGAQPVTATTGPGVATTTLAVLGRAHLKTVVTKKVVRRHKTVVRLTGLGAKEKVKVFLDGRRVAKGFASRKGTFVARFRAPAKLGKHTVTTQGAFGNRKSRATFVVKR